MHIAIPFATDTIRNSFGKPEATWGRDVANHGFLIGLAEAGAGHRITLFVPSQQDIEILNSTLLAEKQTNITAVAGSGIAGYLEEHPVDVLHVTDPNMWLGGHIRNRLSKRDFVITGVTHSLGNQHFLDWMLQNNANGIEPGDCLICTTPTAQTVIESMFAHLRSNQPEFLTPRTEVIPLGTNLAMFRAPTRLTRADLGLPVDDFVILSLARFNPMLKMDLMPLFNLMQMIGGQSERTCRLVIAGSEDDGRYARFLQDKARELGCADSVQFVLSPTDEQKVALFQLADVFLSLSDNVQETFGLTVIEALASGLPAVVSDWNGYRALVDHDVTGVLVPTKTLPADRDWEAGLSLQPDPTVHLLCAQMTAVDLSAARDALLRLAADRDTVARMSRAAAAGAERYDWKQVLPQYLALWERLCHEKATAQIGEAQRNRRTSALRFLQDFASYPSSRLAPGDRFATSELGRRLLQGGQSIQPYDNMKEILDLQLMGGILNACRCERTSEELVGIIRPSATPQETLRISQNVMWLYKYGYLEAR